MNIHFTGHNVEVTPALRELTIDKFKRIERHFEKITSINVIFNIVKNTQIAEATLHVARAELHARAESDDMYSAIDDLIHKLDRQLIKHKEKLKDH